MYLDSGYLATVFTEKECAAAMLFLCLLYKMLGWASTEGLKQKEREKKSHWCIHCHIIKMYSDIKFLSTGCQDIPAH